MLHCECKVSDHELCHSTSKPIGDEKNTLKSIMAFKITPRGLFFRVVVESEIVIPQQSFPHNNTPVTRTHDIDSNTICWTMSYVIPP